MGFSEDPVGDAIKNLKKNKSDPYTELSTACFTEGPYILLSVLAHFFRLCLIHSYFPDELLLAKIIPIIKDMNGDLSSIENYRSISLSSIFLKIWEWLVIILYGDKLKTNDL